MSAIRELLTVTTEFKDEFMTEFLQRVKRRTPVITGNLQRSWEGEVTASELVVKNSADYAGWVESGTSRMEPRRMLALTVLESDAIAQIAAQKVRK
jgi:hypothetical protein